jgi:hypothetical protein
MRKLFLILFFIIHNASAEDTLNEIVKILPKGNYEERKTAIKKIVKKYD